MSGERYYTTKIWPQPSSTGSSNEDASFISTDPRGEPVTSTWKKSCREVETVPEFPELTCQNFRNPQVRTGQSELANRRHGRAEPQIQKPPLIKTLDGTGVWKPPRNAVIRDSTCY